MWCIVQVMTFDHHRWCKYAWMSQLLIHSCLFSMLMLCAQALVLVPTFELHVMPFVLECRQLMAYEQATRITSAKLAQMHLVDGVSYLLL